MPIMRVRMVAHHETYTMADIDKAKGTSGYTMAGSFSGAGGSTLGYSLAGFNPKWANEFDPHAIVSYRQAFPQTHLDTRSITEINADDILPHFNGHPPDLWEGSPPCSKFSTYGRRSKDWNKVTNSDSSTHRMANVEDLFFEWTRLLGELQPRIAVAENVKAMLHHHARGKLAESLKRIESHGYRTMVWELEATRYGVPQIRRRIFVVAWHPDRANRPVIPTPTHNEAVTASQATADLPPDPEPLLINKQTQDYRNALAIPPGSSHLKRFSTKRLHPDQPSMTIATVDTLVHWSNPPRRLSTPEAGRFQTFPDDYPWPQGMSHAVRGARIGNSVPPLLARAVADSIITALNHG